MKGRWGGVSCWRELYLSEETHTVWIIQQRNTGALCTHTRTRSSSHAHAHPHARARTPARARTHTHTQGNSLTDTRAHTHTHTQGISLTDLSASYSHTHLKYAATSQTCTMLVRSNVYDEDWAENWQRTAVFQCANVNTSSLSFCLGALVVRFHL